jgi:hypothetical protein
VEKFAYGFDGQIFNMLLLKNIPILVCEIIGLVILIPTLSFLSSSAKTGDYI